MSAIEAGSSHVCPACSFQLRPEFNYCPHCAHIIRSACAACHARLEATWTCCPICGRPATVPVLSEPTRATNAPAEATVDAAMASAAEDFNQKGVEFYEAEHYDEAIDQFRQALGLDPGNSLYHCNLAVAYGERGDTSFATHEYERALELNPSDLTALLNLGYAYSEQSDPERARAEWQRLIDLAPQSTEAEEARDNLKSIQSP